MDYMGAFYLDGAPTAEPVSAADLEILADAAPQQDGTSGAILFHVFLDSLRVVDAGASPLFPV